MTRKILLGIVVAVLAAGLSYAGGGPECQGAATAKAEEAHANGHANGDAKAEHAKEAGGCSEQTQICLNHMAAKFKNKGWVGLELDKDEETGAMTVTKVEPDSPAVRAGFYEGDVLVALNGVKLTEENHEELYAMQKKLTPGTNVTYTVERHGYDKELKVTLGTIPEDVMAKWVGRHMLEHATVEVAQATR